MVRRKTSEQLAGLRAALSDMKLTAEQLEKQQHDLQVRAAVLSLLARVTAEAADHRKRFGSGSDSGDASVCDVDADSINAALTAVRDVAARSAALGGDVPFEHRVPHMAPGASLLGLEDVTAEEVAEARVITRQELSARLAVIVKSVQEAAAAAKAAADAGAPDAAELAAKERAVTAAAGAAWVRMHRLGLLENPSEYFEFCSRHHVNDRLCIGDDDAPHGQADAVLHAMHLTREQALIYVANGQLTKERKTRATVERTSLTALLSELTRNGSTTKSTSSVDSHTFASLGGVPASSGGGGSATTSNTGAVGLPAERRAAMMGLVAGTAFSGASGVSTSDCAGKGGSTVASGADDTVWDAGNDNGDPQGLVAVDEVVEALEASAARERGVLIHHLLVNTIVCNNEQAGRCIAASWPYPLNGARLVAAARHALLFDADNRLPWARPPGSGGAPGGNG